MMHSRSHSYLLMLGAGAETRGSIAPVVEAYRACGVFKRWPAEHVPTHSDGGIVENTIATLKALRRLAALMLEHGRIVLHIHSTPQASFWRDCLYMAIAAVTRSPVVLQLHGGGFDRFHDESSTPARALMRFFLERAACIVVPSESLRTWVRSITRNAVVSCVPSPVLPREVKPGASRPNMILFLGRLEQTKGVFDLLEAVSALRSEVPDACLVCAGEGDRAGVARYADRLGIRDTVQFTGWVGPSGKRALLEGAAAFVLPSYNAGLPMSLLEAMAAGVPVIASPIGGIPEAVVDGVTGFLVAPGDTATLQRLLRKLLVDRKLAARIGAAAQESVRLRYAPERTIARIEEIYASLGLAALALPAPSVRRADLREAA